MSAGWTTVARQLCDHLQQNEAKLSLLQRIDTEILTSAVAIDNILVGAIHELRALIRVPRVSVYLNAGDQLDLLVSTDVLQPSQLPRPAKLVPSVPGHTFYFEDAKADLGVRDAESAVIAPLYSTEYYEFGILLIESDHPAQLEHLSDPDLVRFVSAVSKQLSLAVRFTEERRLDTERWTIMETILDEDLKPSVGFRILCERLPHFLPPFTACAIDPLPACQILLHAEGDDFLTIVATTGPEPVNTRILVDKSVTGILIRDDIEMYRCNPTLELHYRAYLGPNMRSELALRTRLDERVSAIFNLEAIAENAFRNIHVNALRAATRQLTPILSGLNARRDRTKALQRAQLYSLDRYLEKVADAFTHDIGGPLSHVRLLVDQLGSSIVEGTAGLSDVKNRLRERIAAIETVRKQLATDMVGFSHNDRRNIAAMMREAIALMRPDVLRDRQITFHENFDITADVYCSLFLKEIFVNLLTNAKYWIEGKQKEIPTHHGRIDIMIRREVGEDARGGLEPGLNQKVRVIVRDNGPGMAREHLPNVFERSFTLRKGGTGFGLFAAREYVTSIGGEINANSVAGSFFEVDILLDQYDRRFAAEDTPAFIREDDSNLPPTTPNATEVSLGTAAQNPTY